MGLRHRTLVALFLSISLAAGIFFINGAFIGGRSVSLAVNPGVSPLAPAPAIAGAQVPPDSGTKNTRLQSSLEQLFKLQKDNGPQAALSFALGHGLKMDGGRVQVVVQSAANPADSISSITAAGGQVQTAYNNLIQASVPVDSLTQLAGAASTKYVREPAHPTKSSVTSEGVADIGADVWQNRGYNGAGTKMAVVDLGFAGYNSRISSGDLPANVITKSFRSDGDITGSGEKHGTACAEIAYDVAPGAQLYLVNFSTDVELGNAINYLISQGIQISSASWTFYGDFPGDGTGEIDNMIKKAYDGGIFWANAAGNAAQSHWSGYFTDVRNDGWNDFSGSDEHNNISAGSGQWLDIFLSWNKWPATNQDYDLYLVSPSNTVVASSQNPQTGSQAPTEQIHYQVPVGQGGTYSIMIKKRNASGDAKFQLYVLPSSLQYQVAAESLGGQPSDSPYAMTVGAVQVGTTNLEPYSSQGPTADGRIKPDIVGPDGVSTASYGTRGFWGTSAATPHIAGAGALVKGVYPSYGPSAIQSKLESLGRDLGTPGKDNQYGSGKLNMADNFSDTTPPTITSVKPSGTIYSSSTTISVSYYDVGSGIDTSSVLVTLDNKALYGCTITTSNASCPVSGLSWGSHTIGGSVSDLQKNKSQIHGSFSVFFGLGGGGGLLGLGGLGL